MKDFNNTETSFYSKSLSLSKYSLMPTLPKSLGSREKIMKTNIHEPCFHWVYDKLRKIDINQLTKNASKLKCSEMIY